jgi:hypothetical protein
MKVLTAVVNNPTFIEIQYHTLKKHMKHDYDFIVFNDAKLFPDFTNGDDEKMHKKIQEKCEELNIQCISIPNDHHKNMTCAARRCRDSINFMQNYMLKEKDEYLVLDSDMFLISDFHKERYNNNDCAIVLQNRKNPNINYIWNGIFYFNSNNINDFDIIDWNITENTDVGGMTFIWLKNRFKNLPDVLDIRNSEKNIFNRDGIYFIKHLWSLSWNGNDMPENIKNTKLETFIKQDPRNQNNKYFCEIYDDIFLHYRAGGNWERKGLNFHSNLSELLKDSIL